MGSLRGTTFPGLEKVKTIGWIGGMSRESTQTYYRLVNQHVRTVLESR